MTQNFTKRDIAWIKPVQLKKPTREMSDQELLDSLKHWEIEERIAHKKFENNQGSGSYVAFKGCWTKCQRLVHELKEELQRRNIGTC